MSSSLFPELIVTGIVWPGVVGIPKKCLWKKLNQKTTENNGIVRRH